jgi:alkylation response protein AidB-like acyl-CoA dehydrogenase
MPTDPIARAAQLRERFAARADALDRASAFPEQNFAELHAAGLLGAAIPVEHGGLGLGPMGHDLLTLWRITSELAQADLSLGRCWEGHCNALVLIRGMGTPEQQARWFGEVLERGDRWSAWSGEPLIRKPGAKEGFGTTLTRLDGAWRLDGTKVFCTSAPGVRRAILLVNPEGPGGARHATAVETVQAMVCDMQDPSIHIDDSWWDPIGMRATVSHLVRFEGTVIPDADVLGRPGQYLSERWQTLFVPHYAASFLGAARAAMAYATETLSRPPRCSDPYVQQRAGRIRAHVDTADLWLRRAAELWHEGDRAAYDLAANETRYMVEVLAEQVLQDCVHACGARSLVRPSALERIFRDLTFYFRHDNLDHVLATIGRTHLGVDFDPSFHAP